MGWIRGQDHPARDIDEDVTQRNPQQSAFQSRATLEARLAELEAERDALTRQKRRNLLFLGAAISLLVHLSILMYLDSVRRSGPVNEGARSVLVEFNTLQEEELTELQEAQLEPELPDSLTEIEDMPDMRPDLQADVTPPAAELELISDGAMPTIGGGASGDGSEMTLGGGGGGTQFFGIESEGTRFAYIVDVSGSMSDNNKIFTAIRELARSVDALPDYAYFHVLLYSGGVSWPQFQQGWLRARTSQVTRLINWLDTVTAGGGTQPVPAFTAAFSLDTPPDVIFFLTDGQIPENTAAAIARMNEGRRVVINTVAFGDARSQDQLKEIARNSGGVYRFVRVRSP